MYKGVILLIIFVGILCVSIGIMQFNTEPTGNSSGSNKNSGNSENSGNAGNSEKSSKDPQVEYRYIPRTFEEEQTSPIYPSEIFETMFSQPSPWLMSVRSYDARKQERVNSFFVSQM